jgi:hypothetical protein
VGASQAAFRAKQTGNTIVTHKELVEVAARWAESKHGVVLPEFVHMGSSEICDVIAFNGSDSTMIEVKVSRADFLRDKKKQFRYNENMGMGNYRYYLAPKGLIHERELPDGWGLIEVSPTGRPRKTVWALRQDANHEAERYVLYSYARRAVVKGVHPTIMQSMSNALKHPDLLK